MLVGSFHIDQNLTKILKYFPNLNNNLLFLVWAD